MMADTRSGLWTGKPRHNG